MVDEFVLREDGIYARNAGGEWERKYEIYADQEAYDKVRAPELQALCARLGYTDPLPECYARWLPA